MAPTDSNSNFHSGSAVFDRRNNPLIILDEWSRDHVFWANFGGCLRFDGFRESPGVRFKSILVQSKALWTADTAPKHLAS